MYTSEEQDVDMDFETQRAFGHVYVNDELFLWHGRPTKGVQSHFQPRPM